MAADVTQLMAMVSAAAMPYESRWTVRALRRIDAELYKLLLEQQGLYHEALVTQDDMRQVKEQAEAMCRGWAAATRRMETSSEPDDAYMLGLDSKTGTKVAIGNAKHASERVRQVHGEDVIWFTPDEVAAMAAGLESIKGIAAVKAMWPTAEVIGFYKNEPARRDEE